jgi:hypothetical protein
MSQETLILDQKALSLKQKIAAFVGSLTNMFTELYAGKAERRIITKVYTIGAVGVTGCDFNFVTAANTTAQPIDLGAIIPSTARLIDVVVKTTTLFAGTAISAFGVTIGTTTGGTDLAGSADLILANALNQPAVGAGFTWLAITHAAKHIWVGGAPTGGNWSALTAGKLTVYVTYLDNAAV